MSRRTQPPRGVVQRRSNIAGKITALGPLGFDLDNYSVADLDCAVTEPGGAKAKPTHLTLQLNDTSNPYAVDGAGDVVPGLSPPNRIGVERHLEGLAWLLVALLNQSWLTAFFAAVVVVAMVVGMRARPLELAFNVGQSEQHRVVFRFDKVWGNLSITVDDEPVVRDLRMFSVKPTKTYRFSVGTGEVHDVRIEKDRAVLLAGGRPQPVRAYVDDVLTAEGVA